MKIVSSYSVTLELKISQKSQKNLLDRIGAIDSLLKRYEIDPFTKRLLTGSEKWVRYENNS